MLIHVGRFGQFILLLAFTLTSYSGLIKCVFKLVLNLSLCDNRKNKTKIICSTFGNPTERAVLSTQVQSRTFSKQKSQFFQWTEQSIQVAFMLTKHPVPNLLVL